MSPSRDPSEWYGRLQRAYMARREEALLDELTDIGRLMAVTGFPVEGIVEVHGGILAEELERMDGRQPTDLIRDAAICLSETLVAWRIAAEGIGWGDRDRVEAPQYVWLESDRRLAEGGEGFATAWAEAGRIDDIELAIANRRILSFEFPLRDGDRRLRAVLCPFHDGTAVVGIHDVTARHVAQEADFQRRKLASLGQLAGGVAHEINNLLQPILMTAQFIAEDHAANEELVSDVGVILDAARSAAAVVGDILAFARRSPPKMTSFVLAEAAAREIDLIRQGLPPSARMVSDFGDGGAAVLGNRAELGQVLRNLVGNAVDAIGPAGTISITAECHQLSESDAVRHQIPAGRYLRLTVADDGPGIEAATAERMFDPFFTTKEIGKGTGLGLAIVRSIVHSWNGSIALRAGTQGQGATFDIFLPIVAVAARSSATPRSIHAPGIRVVVVDDNPQVRRGLVRTLERAGHIVMDFENPRTALTFLAGADADVLITDLVMPDMNGFALVEACRRLLPGIEAVVLTGGGDALAGVQMDERDIPGVRAILLKPASGDEVLDAVGKCRRRTTRTGLSTPLPADGLPPRRTED